MYRAERAYEELSRNRMGVVRGIEDKEVLFGVLRTRK